MSNEKQRSANTYVVPSDCELLITIAERVLPVLDPVLAVEVLRAWAASRGVPNEEIEIALCEAIETVGRLENQGMVIQWRRKQ